MKQGIHPNYHNVLFIDTATGNEWVTRSTLTSKDTREVDGEEIPVVKLPMLPGGNVSLQTVVQLADSLVPFGTSTSDVALAGGGQP